MPFQSCGSWERHIRKMLNACGQTGLAEQCAGLCSVISEVRRVPNEPCDVSAPEAQQVRSNESIQRRRPPTLALPITERRVTARFFKWIRKCTKGPMLKGLRRLESLFGYFMPYRLSAMKDDELFGGIESLARDPSIASILVVGASAGEGSTEASLAGARANPSQPIVVCVNRSAVELNKLERRNSGLSYIKCYTRLNGEIRNGSGDGMVVVAAADGMDVVPYDRIDGASVVVLNHINKWGNFKAHQTLLAASSYTLSEHNPSYRDGYAIFRRK